MRKSNRDLGNCYRKKRNAPKVGSQVLLDFRRQHSCSRFYPKGYVWNVTFVKFAVNTVDAQPWYSAQHSTYNTTMCSKYLNITIYADVYLYLQRQCNCFNSTMLVHI